MYGVDTTIVSPVAFSRSRRSQSSRRETASTPVVGSCEEEDFRAMDERQQSASFSFIRRTARRRAGP
jgi:hypothetical protein